MHVDWNWIKQRPQFIADGLSKKYKVEVFYKYAFNRKGYQNQSISKNIHLNPVISLPTRFDKYKIVRKINDYIFKRRIRKYIKRNNVDIIYITFPTFIQYIPNDFNGKIIYDCMDDYEAMEKDRLKLRELKENEQDIINKADVVFFSSIHLCKVMEKRFGYINKKMLIRNGFNGKILKKFKDIKSKNKISYFGTISTWFDFKILEQSLKKFPNLIFELIGPIDKNVKIPNDPRIKYIGVVEHEKLYSTISDSIALMMPFKINDIIKSVDPVKLYEYINFDKNIISVEYPEIERFNRFVYFYNSSEEFNIQLEKILQESDAKYSNKERICFLKENTWDNRIQKIINIIDTK